MKAISKFDGQVTFTMTGTTNLLMAALSRSIRRETSYDDLPSVEQANVNMFVMAYGATIDITFDLRDDADEQLLALRQFWESAQRERDYTVIYQRFLRYISHEVANVWWEARQEARPAHLMAPAEISVDTGDDDDPN